MGRAWPSWPGAAGIGESLRGAPGETDGAGAEAVGNGAGAAVVGAACAGVMAGAAVVGEA